MKLLKDILYKVGLVDVIGSTNLAITSICFDSRNVEKDSLFVAMRGTQIDGHKFIAQVIENGAIVVVCEEIPENMHEKITYVKVKNTDEALGIISSNFYDNPSLRIKLIGITGTNGKTTIATLLYNLFRAFGYGVGLISTVRIKINNEEIAATHTTPDALTLNKIFFEMLEKGCKYCFMEVS